MVITPTPSRTPTSQGQLHGSAQRLGASVAALVLAQRDLIGHEQALATSEGALAVAEFIHQALKATSPVVAEAQYRAAQTATIRTMIALERLAAKSLVPLLRSASLHERLSSMARALGALADRAG
ncbi:MAG: hypothetical protein ACYTDX_00975 [Planctomycetota bacterium]